MEPSELRIKYKHTTPQKHYLFAPPQGGRGKACCNGFDEGLDLRGREHKGEHLYGPRRFLMQIPPPPQVVPSCARWVLGGARQANLDHVTWFGPHRSVLLSYMRMRGEHDDKAMRKKRPARTKTLNKLDNTAKILYFVVFRGPLTQVAEYLPFKQRVASSNLARPIVPIV